MPQNRLAGLLPEEHQVFQDISPWEEPGNWCGHDVVHPEDSVTGLRECAESKTIAELVGEMLIKWQEAVNLETLQRRIVLLEERVALLEQNKPLPVLLETLVSEGCRLLTPISVIVRAEQDEYLATWFDANLTASGCTPEEAVANLKDIIIAVYESLLGHSEKQLAAGPASQLQVLKKYICKSE